MLRKAIGIGLLSALAGIPAWAQNHVDIVATPDRVKWGVPPPSLPKGIQLAVLTGNPMAEGFYVVRLKVPPNTQIPPHYHPTTENVTVLAGDFHAGMGDKLDKKASQAFQPGGFVAMPANMHHFAWTGNQETIVQIDGAGPFAITYVNPEDDPSKR